MPDSEKLTPADPEDLAASLAFALRFEGRKRKHDADTFNPFPLREQTMLHGLLMSLAAGDDEGTAEDRSVLKQG